MDRSDKLGAWRNGFSRWMLIALLAMVGIESRERLAGIQPQRYSSENLVDSWKSNSIDKLNETPEKEKELSKALGQIREAIKEYNQACREGLVSPLDRKIDDQCYPPTLDALVNGVTATGKSYDLVFLRRLPRDPITGKQDWGLRSSQDKKDSESWGGQNVCNVYSKSKGSASDGTKYRDW